MIITIRLPDGRDYVTEAENRAVGTLAEHAAAQMDAHRDRAWTLDRLDPALAAEAAGLQDGSVAVLTEVLPEQPSLFRRVLSHFRS